MLNIKVTLSKVKFPYIVKFPASSIIPSETIQFELSVIFQSGYAGCEELYQQALVSGS